MLTSHVFTLTAMSRLFGGSIALAGARGPSSKAQELDSQTLLGCTYKNFSFRVLHFLVMFSLNIKGKVLCILPLHMSGPARAFYQTHTFDITGKTLFKL